MSIFCSTLFLTPSGSETVLTSFQLECSQILRNVTSEATSVFSIFSLMGAGWIGQASKLFSLSFVSRFSRTQWVRQSSSFLFSAAMEGTFFHGCATLKQAPINLLEFGKGSAHSAIILGGCKISGGIAPQSFILTQLFQCFAIVQINELCGGILVEKEIGTFEQKMVRAVETSLPILFSGQILASCSAGHQIRHAQYSLKIEMGKGFQRNFNQENNSQSSSFGFDWITPEGFQIKNNGQRERETSEAIKKGNIHEARQTKIPSDGRAPFGVPDEMIQKAIKQKRPVLKPIILSKQGRLFGYKYCQETDGAAGRLSHAFVSLLYEGLEIHYQNNLGVLAKTSEISEYKLGRLVAGVLPEEISLVYKIAEACKITESILIKAWEKDFLEITDTLYPLPSTCGPKIRNLVRLVRRVCLHKGKGSFMSTVDKSDPEWTGHYNNLQSVFILGEFLSLKGLKYIYDLLENSNLASPRKIKRRIAEALQEVTANSEFDSFDLDAYDLEVIPSGLNPIRSSFLNQEDLSSLGGIQISENPEQSIMKKELQRDLPAAIERVLATLPPRQRKVIRMRFGLSGPRQTLRETGEELGAGPERMRQIQRRALCKLRHPRRSNFLKFFYFD